MDAGDIVGEMSSRVPLRHYSLRPASSFIGGSLHDLNTVDSHNAAGEIEGISDVDRDAVTEDSLENDDDSNSVDCVRDHYRNPIPLHGVGVDDERSVLENGGRSPTPSCNILTIEDISPIETARARFLHIIVDHFIKEYVIEVGDAPDVGYSQGPEKLNKRKHCEVQYEGDPRFALPLMYVANLYETLVNDVNLRLASLDGIREKTIGVALEASGGLYRRLSQKFPRKGPCSFKRRELATSLATRTRFPELVVQEEKRVRFVVVNGLVIIEKPNSMNIEDAEWFKRLTGREEVAVSARDYKFYSPRHKYKRVTSQSVSNMAGLAELSGTETSSPLPNATAFRPLNEDQQHPLSKHHMQQILQPQFHPFHQGHQQTIQQSQDTEHFPHIHHCTHSSHIEDIPNQHPTQPMPQHVTCLQSMPGCHLGGRLHILPTSPAKFCDECGSPYLRETSKFCSECGTKRLGI